MTSPLPPSSPFQPNVPGPPDGPRRPPATIRSAVVALVGSDRARTEIRRDAWTTLTAKWTRVGIVEDARVVLEGAPVEPDDFDILIVEACGEEAALAGLQRSAPDVPIVLITRGSDYARCAHHVVELGAHAVAPSTVARNRLVAELAQRMPTGEALRRTFVLFDPVADEFEPDDTHRKRGRLVTFWEDGDWVAEVVDAFAELRELDPSLELRVLGAPDGTARRRTPNTQPGVQRGVESVHVTSLAQVEGELRRAEALYHPSPEWPSSSVSAPALANAVGTFAYVSAQCAAAEAVFDARCLLNDEDPRSFIERRRRILAGGSTPDALGAFRTTAVVDRWRRVLEEVVRSR